MKRTILNDSNPELVLQRDFKKITSQSIHTTNGEVLKFREGWYEATVTQQQHISNKTYLGVYVKQ